MSCCISSLIFSAGSDRAQELQKGRASRVVAFENTRVLQNPRENVSDLGAQD